MAAQRWVLFVDESGRFDEPEDDPVVAGLLISTESRAMADDRALTERLRKGADWVPWPFHAWLLNRAVSHAVWAAAFPEKAHMAAERAARELREIAPRELESAVQLVRRSKEPTADQLHNLHRALVGKQEKRLRELDLLTNRVRESISAAIRDLAADRNMFLFVAGQSKRGEAPTPGAVGGDLYLEQLETLCERVEDALQEQGGLHLIELRVLDRSAAGYRRIETAHLEGCLPSAPGKGSPITWESRPPAIYGADVKPQLVLADICANAWYGAIKRPHDNLPLAETVAAAGRQFEVPTYFSDAELQHLAASGEARRFLGDVSMRKEPGPLRCPPVRPWARGQAEAWARVLA